MSKYIWGGEEFDTKEECEEAIASSCAQFLECSAGSVQHEDEVYSIEITAKVLQ